MSLDTFDSLERKIEDIVERYTRLKEEKERLEGELRERDTRLTSLEERCMRFEIERESIKAKVDALLKRLEQLNLD